MSKNLVIVESPAKAKTISRFLGEDFEIKASMGHIRDLPAKSLGVDVKAKYEPEYQITSDKKKIVKELKTLADKASIVWLATDEDQEGEAISWHLVQALELDESQTKRIVFHEITKSAILKAIETPRRIDVNLVDAQQARRILDRLVGFELSPLLWRKVMPKLSAGRVQSVATRLIVDKEDEIKAFNAEEYFKIGAAFKVEESKLNAELTENKDQQGKALEFLQDCIDAQFTVKAIETKPARKSPPPPYTTSTLQQDASRKLGFSVSKTMMIAQQLYESGKITYMRTDSVNLSDLALNTIKQEVIKEFGEDHYKRRTYKTKSKGAQEAHEAIRPTYAGDKDISGTADQIKLYTLIWKRAMATQMKDAELERTTVTIKISTRPELLTAKAEIMTFAGFLKIYNPHDNKKENLQLIPELHKGQELELFKMIANQRYTSAPARYNEAMLVKKLEELGIGRPSTYAPIISTIQKRNYVEKKNKPALERKVVVLELAKGKISEKQKVEKYGAQKGKLFPTDIGIVVNEFLIKHFSEILDYNFTASVVAQFDQIAEGKLAWREMLEEFYQPFHQKVEITGKESKKFTGKKYLGDDPKSGRKVYARLGKYGPMVQIGDSDEKEKPLFASLSKNQSLDEVTLQDAIKLFSFPREIGDYKDEKVLLATGRYGPYIKYGKSNYSLGKGTKLEEVNLEFAIKLIEEQKDRKKNQVIKDFGEKEGLRVLNGRYGPYISYKRKNYKITSEYTPSELELEDCYKIIEAAKDRKKKRTKKS